MALNYIKWAGMALWPQKPEMLAATSSWDETLMVILTKASWPRRLGTMPHGTQISYIGGAAIAEDPEGSRSCQGAGPMGMDAHVGQIGKV
jgi:hypothetical protein